MISFLHGRVAATNPTAIILEVGGVGLELLSTPRTLAQVQVGETVTLPTSLVVREDSLTLYGFSSEEEKSAFLLAQNVSGVGPRLAQAIINTLTPEQLYRAIITEDVKTLTTVPGIGKKSAQRLVLELKDRLPATLGTTGTEPEDQQAPWRDQVHSGLVGLGWSSREADEAITNVTAQVDTMDSPDVSHVLRLALQWLKRN